MGRIETDNVRWDEKGHTMISHIYVSFSKGIRAAITGTNNAVVTSVQFGYLENGALVLSPKYGASEGHNFQVVSFVSVNRPLFL